MLKYFKWELLSELKKIKGFLIALFITYFFVGITDINSANIFSVLMLIELYVLAFCALYYGGKRTIDTYSKKTFLLESMIPISANKLLLVKYLVAAIVSLSSCILLFIGFAIIGGKIDIEFFINVMKYLIGNANFYDVLFKAFVLFTSFSIFVTSLMTASFVLLKSVFPSLKKVKALSYVLTYLAAYIFFQIVSPLMDGSIFTTSLIFIIGSVVCYFVTVALVENKLEVYN